MNHPRSPSCRVRLWHIAAQSIGRIADGLRRETNAANSPHEAVVLPATETSRNQPHLQVSYSQSSFQKKFCSSSALDTKIGSAEFQFSLFSQLFIFYRKGLQGKCVAALSPAVKSVTPPRASFKETAGRRRMKHSRFLNG